MKRIYHIGTVQSTDLDEGEDFLATAAAKGSVLMAPETLQQILSGNIRKGDVLAAAQLAGIMTAKRTADIVPVHHAVNMSKVDMTFDCIVAESRINIEARVKSAGIERAEMEALTAVQAAALTVFDMCKSIDKYMIIYSVQLDHKPVTVRRVGVRGTGVVHRRCFKQGK